ncbi:XRE family transcriptional regulator [Mesorhizobium sp. M4B.F.Ca.ET.190.01.1.1]|uniref:helix-turn-helix domain-containing protein n=1 Tax=unclassified Mesorhizobium TaxID=325217 RepID=UPI001092EC8F|nr:MULTISPECIES: helix-turn-helix transcriptional regulator [unclassified Mesorhizobium]TGR01287.1 XRE family transcriptional regulator [Mesorhizobium sp. M4B.F.Ca.ET.200.01.1.1]TGS13103.1 XRE family transcriptional regulator [Mesorhizobium sp. M4B.F.Ca.ET.190.01.1.1]TGT25482.1 XRE family transcriptional regulator [Mesorhizobium sp. M4B.F.Ca.ET.172.01.1.1]
MEVQSLVAWNLRRLRVERGISQDDLALSAGIERAYVGHLERAARNPTIFTLEKVAIALDVHIAQLFREPDPGEQVPTTLKAGRKKAR